MAEYTAQCLDCDLIEDRSYFWAEWDLLPVHAELESKIMGPCTACGSQDVVQTLLECPQIMVNGEIEVTAPAYNIAHGKRSAKDQQRHYSKKIKASREAAEKTARARSGSKRSDGEIRHVGSIPKELYIAMVRQTGDKRYWDRSNDSTKILKRHGLYFEK